MPSTVATTIAARDEDLQPPSLSGAANLDIISQSAKHAAHERPPADRDVPVPAQAGCGVRDAATDRPALADAAPRGPGNGRAAARLSRPAGEAGRRTGTPSGVLVEIFDWKSAASAEVAHRSPEVMAIWEPMGALCEAMEFPHFERIAVDFRR